MTIRQLRQKYRGQLRIFDKEYTHRRANIIRAQKKHIEMRKKSGNGPGTKMSAKYSSRVYNLLLKPLIAKNRKF